VGRELLGLSPFRAENTPSFTVNDANGTYHCFASGEHGDIFTFVMKTEGLAFPEAVERLAQEARVGINPDKGSGRDRTGEAGGLTPRMACGAADQVVQRANNRRDLPMTTEAHMEAFQAKASALAAKAVEFCNGDTAEATVLVAAVAAMLTMMPFNKAATIAVSEARIASRTAEHEAFVDHAIELFVGCYRDAMPMARTSAMVLMRNDAMPAPGRA
jgi:hypothetical protein